MRRPLFMMAVIPLALVGMSGYLDRSLADLIGPARPHAAHIAAVLQTSAVVLVAATACRWRLRRFRRFVLNASVIVVAAAVGAMLIGRAPPEAVADARWPVPYSHWLAIGRQAVTCGFGWASFPTLAVASVAAVAFGIGEETRRHAAIYIWAAIAITSTCALGAGTAWLSDVLITTTGAWVVTRAFYSRLVTPRRGSPWRWRSRARGAQCSFDLEPYAACDGPCRFAGNHCGDVGA